MADHNSPFVSTSLNPARIGDNSKFYELTSESVTPTVVYVDAEGNTIEERVPVHYSTNWVGIDGCVKSVPMRTSAVFSMDPQHVSYENVTSQTMIKAGQLPLAACPWTFKYSFITGGTLARSKTPGADCGGKPTGCEHMLTVISDRKATALVKAEKQERIDNAKTEKQILQMAKTITQALGDREEAARAAAPNAPKIK